MRGALGLTILVFVLTSVGCGESSTGGAGTAAGGSGGTAAMCTKNAATATTSPFCRCIPGAFVQMGACACQSSLPDICPTVGCVDQKVDASNCGACGTACAATSTCNGGTCGPAPTMLAGAIAGCTAMTMVATDAVYFADAANGTINKLGTTTPLATGEPGATLLQANGTNLFWYSPGMKKIRRMVAGGGAVVDVYASVATSASSGTPLDITGFLVSPDGATIYVSLGNQVLEAPVAGGPTTVVANDVQRYTPVALALNGTTSIVFTAFGDGPVQSALLGGMPATCGASDPMNPGSSDMTTCARLGYAHEVFPAFIAVISGHAYWIDAASVEGELIGMKGTVYDTIANAQSIKITAAAATADAIYFADADPNDVKNGFIEKTALAPNSTPVLLARGQKSPIAIAVDATKVYWATSDCAIVSQSR